MDNLIKYSLPGTKEKRDLLSLGKIFLHTSNCIDVVVISIGEITGIVDQTNTNNNYSTCYNCVDM